MTVNELINVLKLVDQDRLVVIATMDVDESELAAPLERTVEGSWDASKGWGLDTLTDKDREQGYDESDLVDGTPCVVLVPE